MIPVILDFDGVLVNSREAYVDAFAEVLSEHGYRTSREIVSEKLLPSAPKTIEALVGKTPDLNEMVKEARVRVAEKAKNIKASGR
ncbi:MAG: HAD hydrolase-like protein [archaeon]